MRYTQFRNFYTHSQESILTLIHVKRKENFPLIQYKEIQMGSVAKSYMRKGFLIYEKMRKYLTIYEKEAVSHL